MMEDFDAGVEAKLEDDRIRGCADSASLDGIRIHVDALRVYERSSRSINRLERFARDFNAGIRSERNRKVGY